MKKRRGEFLGGGELIGRIRFATDSNGVLEAEADAVGCASLIKIGG